MAYNEVIDGNLTVLGSATLSAMTVTNALTVNSGVTVSFNTGSNVYFTPTTLTLTAGQVSSAIISAVTQNSRAGKLTTTALTAAAASVWSLVLTNSLISTTDQIYVTVTNGTNTGDGPHLAAKLQSSGAVTIACRTISALNGTLIFDYVIFK